jgi:hypothetical protein
VFRGSFVGFGGIEDRVEIKRMRIEIIKLRISMDWRDDELV